MLAFVAWKHERRWLVRHYSVARVGIANCKDCSPWSHRSLIDLRNEQAFSGSAQWSQGRDASHLASSRGYIPTRCLLTRRYPALHVTERGLERASLARDFWTAASHACTPRVSGMAGGRPALLSNLFSRVDDGSRISDSRYSPPSSRRSSRSASSPRPTDRWRIAASPTRGLIQPIDDMVIPALQSRATPIVEALAAKLIDLTIIAAISASSTCREVW